VTGFFSRFFGGKETSPGAAKAVEAKSPGARVRELQAAYWCLDHKLLRSLQALPYEELKWPEALRLHHQLCLEMHEHGEDWVEAEHARLITHLCAPNSPYRPRHAFVWEGDGPPEGEDVPYSTHQGRLANACLSHLATFEVVTLDAEFQPLALQFIPFDAVMTLAATPTEDARGARLLLEYGKGERVVLLTEYYGHSEPLEVEGLDKVKLPAPLAQTQLLGSGPQRLRRLSDFAAEGLAEFSLRDCYQISLAIEAEDPRFEQKCRGRELDPVTMRADLQREQQGKRDRQKKKLRLRTL
jgi:hypothetical protein